MHERSKENTDRRELTLMWRCLQPVHPLRDFLWLRRSMRPPRSPSAGFFSRSAGIVFVSAPSGRDGVRRRKKERCVF